MSDTTNIEWADSTFNPWMGCTKVSPACDHCYAERDTKRFGRVEWGAGKPRVRTSPANWKLPERWNAAPFYRCTCGWRGDAAASAAHRCDGAATLSVTRRRIFCASLADWLDNEVPIEWLVDLLDLIRRTPNLDWLLLTKRIGNWRPRLLLAHEKLFLSGQVAVDSPTLAFIHDWLDGNPPANVWLGSTVIDQAEADRDVLKLLAVAARIRFLSIEPMLGPISLRWMCAWPENAPTTAESPSGITDHLDGLRRLDWVIAGGESGPHARLMHPDWVCSLRDQCAAAGVPFLFKQWGEWAPVDPDMPSELQESEELAGKLVDGMHRIGKKAAGRKLDGRTHDSFPIVQP